MQNQPSLFAKLLKSPSVWIGFVLVFLIAVMGLAAPLLSSSDPSASPRASATSRAASGPAPSMRPRNPPTLPEYLRLR